jgi:hypothetical protein
MNKQHAQLVERLEASAGEVADALARLPDEILNRMPPDGGWSLHANLSHLRDTEVRVFMPRVQLTLSQDAPPMVQNFDQEEWMRGHYGPDEPVKQMVGEFRAARRKLVKLLQTARDKDWARCAIHPLYGRIPIEYTALHCYAHTLEHLQQFLNAYETELLNAANREGAGSAAPAAS